jgi:uncharacterized protein YihD (DUF1040 family)
MRNPERINEILELLTRGWKKVPDWRFGQVIENLKRYLNVPDLFYVEDDILKAKIIDYFDLDEMVESNEGVASNDVDCEKL